MNKKELKEKLHRQIDELEDEAGLNMLYKAAAEYGKVDVDILDELTPAQLERLEESLRQADEGKTIPHEEVMKLCRAWLAN
jgi:predicted transcriptional regulator